MGKFGGNPAQKSAPYKPLPPLEISASLAPPEPSISHRTRPSQDRNHRFHTRPYRATQPHKQPLCKYCTMEGRPSLSPPSNSISGHIYASHDLFMRFPENLINPHWVNLTNSIFSGYSGQHNHRNHNSIPVVIHRYQRETPLSDRNRHQRNHCLLSM